MVESIFAVKTAGRWGTTSTEVRSRGLVVIAAAKVTTVSWSRQSPEPPPGISPESE